mmetsp:Transcript_26544/g.56339  ORF Transcript_26544/g.56339 Transcript_26544/m.56339 type:complete len:237 (-) Transcript_26544:745-1455(-)
MPSRRPSRSSRRTCSCIWTSSCLAPCNFMSSMRRVSVCLSVSSASTMVAILSSSEATRTCQDCPCACNKSTSSLWLFRTWGPSRPSARRNFMRFISSSNVSRRASIANSCSRSSLTVSASVALVSERPLAQPVASANSCRIRVTSGLSTCAALWMRLARNSSTCPRSCAFCSPALAASARAPSSWAWRSLSSARVDSTSRKSSWRRSSWRRRPVISSSSRSCKARKLDSSSRVGEL